MLSHGASSFEIVISPRPRELKTTGLVLSAEEGLLHMADLKLLNIPNEVERIDWVKNVDIEALLVLFTPSTQSLNPSLDYSTAALFLSCDSNVLDENRTYITNNATTLYRLAVQMRPKAIILYSSRLDSCSFSSQDGSGEIIFTLVNKRETFRIANQLRGGRDFTRVTIKYSSNRGRELGRRMEEPPPNPDGQEGTAVSLIVLYAVTGVITAFFLSLLISGAIRAHRHPERYQREIPNHLGVRQRPSRARGIARAALDTIPIVRFGPRPTAVAPKEVDMEMQETESSVSRGVRTSNRGPEAIEDPINPAPSSQFGGNIPAFDDSSAITLTPSSRTPPASSVINGISNVTTPTPPPQTTPSPDLNLDQLRCPVCMDDFEEGQELRVLPCRHSFHPDCIDPWLLNIAASCPLCRIDLRPLDEREADVPHLPTTPPPAALRRHITSGSTGIGRLMEVATRTSSREERLAALRAIREENQSQQAAVGAAQGTGRPVRAPRSRMPELGVTRLRRALFGAHSTGDHGSADLEPENFREDGSRGRLVGDDAGMRSTDLERRSS